MRPAVLLSLHAVVAAGFCVGLCAVPAFWITLYGAAADRQAVLLLRLIGALFGGLAVMSWMGRGADIRSGGPLVLGLAVSHLLAAIVATSGAISGVYNAFAWGPAGLFTAFTVGFLLTLRKAQP